MSRQLEELRVPVHKLVPKQPLLATGFMSKKFESQTETYLNEVTRARIKFYEYLFIESKNILIKENAETSKLLADLTAPQKDLIVAKAFRSAVVGSSSLLKPNTLTLKGKITYRGLGSQLLK